MPSPIVEQRLQGMWASVVSARELNGCGSGLESTGSAVVEHRLSPGVELTSPALAGGFFTTEPPGKPPTVLLSLVFRNSFLLLPIQISPT